VGSEILGGPPWEKSRSIGPEFLEQIAQRPALLRIRWKLVHILIMRADTGAGPADDDHDHRTTNLDTPAQVSIIAFAVAIPLLAALVLVNRQEAFRGRQTTSKTVMLARVIAQLAAFVGVVAAFWDITWFAGVTFLVAGLVAVGVHSAGFWRVESPLPPTSEPS